MPFTISPGVLSREIDLTTVVPTIATTRGGFAGPFLWGPVGDPQNGTVQNDTQLQETFWRKNEATAVSYLSASNFLKYGGTLEISRVVGGGATNASTANTTYGATVAGSTVAINNFKSYTLNYDQYSGGTPTSEFGPFVAKYPGERGNSLRISICGPDKPEGVLSGTWTIDAASGMATATTGNAIEELRVGDVVSYLTGANASGAIGYAIVLSIQDATGADAVTFGSSDQVTGALGASGTVITRLKRSSYEEDPINMIGTIEGVENSKTITGTNTQFQLQLVPGDILTVTESSVKQRFTVSSITNDDEITVKEMIKNTITVAATWHREWEFKNSCPADAPSTSSWADSNGGVGALYDEIHIAIVNKDGKWFPATTQGVAGQAMQYYTNLSVATNADGGSNYYKTIINNSPFCYCMNTPTVHGDSATDSSESSWGSEAGHGTKFPSSGFRATYDFLGGDDGAAVTDSELMVGFDKFKEPVNSDISVLFTGGVTAAVSNHVIGIAEYRKDIMAFVSPELSDVLSEINQATNVIDFRNSLPSSSYASMDSGWKRIADGGATRYIPLNSDCAGLAVETEDSFGAFYSPAGFSRGQIRSVVDLVWNPSADDRDRMYKKGVNSVVRFPGQGTVLFGDKTLLAKPNAFDRINVRRLFISLEKSISRAAQQNLFEFNDDFTRSQFTSIVEPFLRDIQARGGITDFLVVCDDSNNPGNVIDNNQFVGSIYVKPARSINFIELNFVAVRTGVEFSEVVGQR
jgi:hypothetical protein